MTLQATITGASALANISFGPNEIASCLVIAKSIGSLFSRDENASLFRVLEDQFGVHVTRLPVWLADVSFRRSPRFVRQNMRSHTGLQAMENVQIRSLEGLATFLVLITRNVLSKAHIVSLLESLLLGGLGAIVTRGQLEALPYNMKPLLRTFVEATIDCDADCRQSTTALAWMAELCAMVGNGSQKISQQDKIAIRLKHIAAGFLSELFGGPTVAEEMDRILQPTPQPCDTTKSKIRVFDALSLHAAYMALTARANGSDIVVDVIMHGVAHQIPRDMSTSASTFHVRLWLCQPPAEVLRTFRWLQSSETSDSIFAGHGASASRDHDEADITIFGGETEVAQWTARLSSYTAAHLVEHDVAQAVRELWSMGQDLAAGFQWKVTDSTTHKRPLRFHFQHSGHPKTPIQPATVDLARLFQQVHPGFRGFKALARAVATSVHHLYQYDNYHEDALGEHAQNELIGAMRVLVTSFAIASLEQMTNVLRSNSGSRDYAVSRRALVWGDGTLCDVIGRALTPDGVAFHRILWAAATVWGGANFESQGSSVTSDGVIGIVAPQCTVLIDCVRDPLNFVKAGASAKLLTVLHGAIPMLPRDPKTGFMRTESGLSRHKALVEHNDAPDRYFNEGFRSILSTDMLNPPASILSLSEALNTDSAEQRGAGGLLQEMVITFEPVATDPTLGTFCAWYIGNLTYEIDPAVVFMNVVKRTPANLKTIKYNEGDSHDWGEAFVGDRFSGKSMLLDQMQLLEIGHFRVDKGCVVVRGSGQCGWLVFMAGLAHAQTIFVRDTLNEAQIRDIEDKLVDGDVLIMYD